MEAAEQAVASVRQECAELRAKMAADTARLEGVATSALAECAQQRQELERLRQGSGPPTSEAALAEAYHELERLELTLVEERRRYAVLEEEKMRVEESHKRDVNMLEGMLQQVVDENERLKRELAAWEATKLEKEGNSQMEVAPVPALLLPPTARPPTPKDGNQSPTGTAPSEVDEPEMEPRRVCYTSPPVSGHYDRVHAA
mmetsp:Transcript_72475/g.125697  ORF Transcript_72475/g.125697 Transcript_72475/m.125697 type:complete len:201 (-) Transcript_72475:103-705(-)